MVVADVALENPLRVTDISDDDVVQAITAKGPDHALAEGVRLRGSRRSGEQAGAKTPNSRAERGAVDGVAVVDEEAGYVIRVGGRLDQPLRGPGSARMLRHADVNKTAATQGEDHEHVQHAEPGRDDDEEVAGPSLVQVVADEGHPPLPSTASEAGGAVLGHGARRHPVAELGQLPGDAVLPPRGVVA